MSKVDEVDAENQERYSDSFVLSAEGDIEGADDSG